MFASLIIDAINGSLKFYEVIAFIRFERQVF